MVVVPTLLPEFCVVRVNIRVHNRTKRSAPGIRAVRNLGVDDRLRRGYGFGHRAGDSLGRGLGFMVEDGVTKTVLIFDQQADSVFALLSLTCPRLPPCPA